MKWDNFAIGIVVICVFAPLGGYFWDTRRRLSVALIAVAFVGWAIAFPPSIWLP